MRKFLSVNPDICIGCRLCELACAMSKENVFNPKKARIKVDMIGFPEVPVPVVSRLCDSCAGKPQCLKYCPVGCISFIEGNPKPDQKNLVLTEIVAEDWLQRNTVAKEEDNADNT